MAKLLISATMLMSIMALLQPQKGYGRGYVVKENLFEGHYIIMPADSVLPAHNPADKPIEKPVEKTIDPSLPEIKEVPKSRRVVKPMAIPSPLPIQPIRIIKPKIIIKKLI